MMTGNWTSDHIEVPANMKLCWTWLAIDRELSSQLYISASFQREGSKRRPYLTVQIGHRLIQVGWLWS